MKRAKSPHAPLAPQVWRRTPALERWTCHVACGGIIATGVLLHVMKDWMAPPDEFSVVNHPLQPTMLHGHVLLAPLFMLAIGMLLRRHILPRALDPASTRGRRSGLAVLGLLAPMIASGYLLQVMTNERTLLVLKWSHVISGVAFALAYASHVVATLRRLPRVGVG